MQVLAALVVALLVADVAGVGVAGSGSSSTAKVSAGRPGTGGTGGATPSGVAPGASQAGTSGTGGAASSGAGSSGATRSGSTRTGATTRSGGGSGGTSGTGGSASGLANLGHGVTAGTIKVVFPWPNLGPLGQAVGLYGTSEDDQLSIKAAVSAINDAGGINGRKIDPEIVGFNPLDEASMRALCIKWTQDQKVFAVVDAAAWHDDAQLCITQENHTPLISTWTTVSDFTNRGNPNLWWTGADAAAVLDNLVAFSASNHTLSPSQKFGVVAADRTGDILAAKYLTKDLANAGLKATDTESMHFDLADSATAQAQARDIVTRFKLAGIHTILPLLPYTDLVYLVQAAKEQESPPGQGLFHWLLSDYEFGDEAAIGLIDPSVGGPYASELDNTVNPTFFDLGNCDCNKPLPQGYDPFGTKCWQDFKKYSGAAWAKQNPLWDGYIETTGTAMIWCTDIQLFAAAARAVPASQLTQANFDKAMMGLTHFAGQFAPDYSYSGTRRSGPHQFRVVQEHVNGDGKCPRHADGGSAGDCWLILQDWREALHT